MKIAFLAKKGGAGKTTSSLLVAEALRQAGNHVALQDFDKQGSSTKSLHYSGSEVEIAVPKSQYTYILFDTPPNLEHPATHVAVKQADVIIVVTGQTVVDFWEVGEAVAFAEKTNPKAVVRVLVNRVKAGTILGAKRGRIGGDATDQSAQNPDPRSSSICSLCGWRWMERAGQDRAGSRRQARSRNRQPSTKRIARASKHTLNGAHAQGMNDG